jgi:long-chain fatty acid transport protein
MLAAATLLTAAPAFSEVGPAFTGMTGRADDASAAFFSPAGITRLERPEVGIQTIFVDAESRFDVDEATFEGGDADNDDRVLVIPAVFYVHPLSERWSLGFALNVPSGIGHEYGKDWSG